MAQRQEARRRTEREGLLTRDWALPTLAAIAAVMFLRTAAALFIPIVLAILLAYALNPAVRLLQRLRLPRPVASAACIAAVALAIGFAIVALQSQALAMIRQLPEAVQRLREAAEAGSAGTLMERLRETSAVSGDGGVSLPLGSLLWQGGNAVMTLLVDAVMIAFLTFFLLVAAPGYYERFIVIGPGDRRTAREVLDDISEQIERFIIVRLGTAAGVAAATGVSLSLLGVENAAMWGIMAGLFNSVPYFGPVIVSGGLAVIGLVQFGSVGKAAVVSGVALGITTLEGWLITPPLLGRVARMSAIAVFLGLLVWAWIWGVWGTLLAMPMLVVLHVISHHSARLEPLSRLLDSHPRPQPDAQPKAR